MASPVDTFTERQYGTYHLPEVADPGWTIFKHTRAKDKPTPPAFPGTLDAAEQAEVTAWLDGLVAPTLPDAITFKTAYVTYYKAMDAWRFADFMARKSQLRIAVPDSIILNKPTLSQSGDTGGTGSAPPGGSVPRNDP